MAEPYPTPPMAEILASIRRIITEDAPRPGETAQDNEPLASDGDEADEDVLVLGPAEAVVPEPMPMPAPVEAAAPVAAAVPPPEAGGAGLLSATAHEASQRALAALSGLAVDPRAEANTLDGLVREMLRPMLKEWLDTHLPEIVERVVAREVARISGR